MPSGPLALYLHQATGHLFQNYVIKIEGVCVSILTTVR